MATIYRDIEIATDACAAWARLRDVGRAHDLFTGVLADCRIDGDVRTVTFADGHALRERIVTVDDRRMRVVYSVLDDVFLFHAASMQIVGDSSGRCRFLWTTDVLPEDAEARITPLIDRGCLALKSVFEAG